MLGTYSYLQFI